MQGSRQGKQGRPKRRRSSGPIADAITSWLLELPPHLLDELSLSSPSSATTTAAGGNHDDAVTGVVVTRQALLVGAPKRWVAYEPMVLLPSGSFTAEPWASLLRRLDRAQMDALWGKLLRAIVQMSGGTPLTHLAVNEGIPLRATEDARQEQPRRPNAGQGDAGAASSTVENVLRSPSGLRMLYGDFGSGEAVAQTGTETASLSDEVFEAGFWVSTKQNGLYQAWAPRWTMFSRGNVKEKARLLHFHDVTPASESRAGGGLLSRRSRTKSELGDKWAVDLYAGIGYFVFSYARLGLRVLCWELNPWSVEGLRRGAEMNRWSVQVIRGVDLHRPTTDVVTGQDQIVVFLEDNRRAEQRVHDLRCAGMALDVLHVNCGFLPSSSESWLPAWNIQGPSASDGWLHLHENMALADIEARRRTIQDTVDGWSRLRAPEVTGFVDHVELVKTFAPDVWHCVFDIYITKSSGNGSSSRSRNSET